MQLFRNSNWFLRTVDRQFEREFRNVGAKIGSQLRMRLPNDYLSGPPERVGPVAHALHALNVQVESAPSLSLDDYCRRILTPVLGLSGLDPFLAADAPALPDPRSLLHQAMVRALRTVERPSPVDMPRELRLT